MSISFHKVNIIVFLILSFPCIGVSLILFINFFPVVREEINNSLCENSFQRKHWQGEIVYLKSIVSLVKPEMNLLQKVGTCSDRIEGN